jgi:hypothetical protein
MAVTENTFVRKCLYLDNSPVSSSRYAIIAHDHPRPLFPTMHVATAL